MTSGNNFDYFPENQLTKVNAGTQKFMYFLTGGVYAPYVPCMFTPLLRLRYLRK